jgi:hypothetical protein
VVAQLLAELQLPKVTLQLLHFHIPNLPLFPSSLQLPEPLT